MAVKKGTELLKERSFYVSKLLEYLDEIISYENEHGANCSNAEEYFELQSHQGEKPNDFFVASVALALKRNIHVYSADGKKTFPGSVFGPLTCRGFSPLYIVRNSSGLYKSVTMNEPPEEKKQRTESPEKGMGVDKPNITSTHDEPASSTSSKPSFRRNLFGPATNINVKLSKETDQVLETGKHLKCYLHCGCSYELNRR